MSDAGKILSIGLDVTAVPSEPVGAGRYTIELVRALSRRDDVSITAFARRADSPRWNGLQSELGPTLKIRPTAPRSRPARLAYGQLGLARDVHRQHPGIQVFHGPHYQAPRGLGCPLVVTVHDLTFVEHPEWHERSKVVVFSRALAHAAERADVVICVSQRTADRFRERYRPKAEVSVVVHGIDHERFCPAADAEKDALARERLGVRSPYLLHLGTIEPRKNVPNLIRAFGRLSPQWSDLSLVLAGQLAWGANELGQAMADSRVADRIVQLGYIDDDLIAPLLRGAAAVAYPSIEEGFGLPALEALACGAPLVTTTDSVMSEFAGSAALTVLPDDIDGLTSALEELLRGGSAGELRRARGFERARHFTWAESAAGHVDAYHRALDR